MPSPGSVSSPFFNNYDSSQEQFLLEDLVIEAISIYGLDFFYIPRVLHNFDDIHFQDDVSTYDQAIQVVCYVKSYEGFGGEGSFMSKFGLEIRDQITFTIASRVFQDEIGHPYSLPRPREGDLIYYPLNHKVFQIKYVEDKPIHYPLGVLPTFDMYCELFEYSGEQFNTGIPEIDRIQNKLTTNIYEFALLTDQNELIVTDQYEVLVTDRYNEDVINPIEINTEISEELPDLIDFSEDNPFGELR